MPANDYDDINDDDDVNDDGQGSWKSSSSSLRGRLQCCQSVYTWQRLTRGSLSS